MKQQQDAYIVAATRTPIGRSHKGFFRNYRPDDLLATILKSALAQVPTLQELGLPAANLNSVFGIFAPAGVPPAVLDRVNAEINRALALPDIQARLQASDNLPTGGTAAQFRQQIAAESEGNARIIRAADIRLN